MSDEKPGERLPLSDDEKRRASDELQRRINSPANQSKLLENLERHRQGLPVQDPVLAGFLRFREKARQRQKERRIAAAEDERNRKLIEAIQGLGDKQEAIIDLAQSGARDKVNRRRAAREATKERESRRAEERGPERDEWDQINAALGQQPRTERTRIILKRRLAVLGEGGGRYVTYRAIYDYLSIKERPARK